MADQSASQPSREETCVDDGSKTPSDAAAVATEGKAQDDSELNDLLNSALKDFNKVKISSAADTSTSTSGATADTTAQAGAAGGKPEGAEANPMSGEFNEMFSQQFAAQFEETMATLMSQNPECMKQFEKLVDAANTAGDSEEAQQNFMSTLTQTLSDMTSNAEGIQVENLEAEAGAEPQGEDFMPMMQELMQTLLSKNVLYPSLKEIASKYPTYLANNDLETSDREMYQKQYDLMTSICSVYEEENTEDTPELKAKRFEKLLDLMQQMQELGQPPKDIVGEMAPGLQFDENGMPKLPGLDSSQCSVM